MHRKHCYFPSGFVQHDSHPDTETKQQQNYNVTNEHNLYYPCKMRPRRNWVQTLFSGGDEGEKLANQMKASCCWAPRR
jgi:hypothetical protein